MWAFFFFFFFLCCGLYEGVRKFILKIIIIIRQLREGERASDRFYSKNYL